ncbi:MAG TPA: hypothetical protein DCW90_05950 [Lachnospiraceae bacterium]|nr:hypothetical protein [Lachnospiraceae bacterium]
MSETKKYLDNLAAQELVKQIKAEDKKAIEAAKSYADDLADNYDQAGAAATAEQNAKTYTDTEIGKVKETVKANTDAITAINDSTTGILAQAKADAKEKADAVDAKVTALDKKVGVLPTGVDVTATTVIEYVDEKVAKVNSDASALTGRVTQAEKDIDAIEVDYLKAADKTELEGKIGTVDGKVDAVSDKVTTLVGDDANKSVRTIANEELTKQLIPEGAKDSLDTLQEIAAWIQSHPDDAAAMNTAIQNLQALVGTIPADVTDVKTIVAYIQKLVEAEKTRATGVESGLDTRLQAVEAKLGDGEDSVSSQIATAKQEAIDAAAADATTKSNKALEDAKKHTDDEVAKDRARLDAVEAKATQNAEDIAAFTAITAEEIRNMFTESDAE